MDIKNYTNPFQHPYYSTPLMLEAQLSLVSSQSKITSSKEKLEKLNQIATRLTHQFQAITLSLLNTKYPHHVRIIWPSPLIAVPLVSEPECAVYLICEEDSHLPRFVFKHQKALPQTPVFVVWHQSITSEVSCSVNALFINQTTKANISLPSSDSIPFPETKHPTIQKLVLSQAIFAAGRLLAIRSFKPEIEQSPYAQALKAMTEQTASINISEKGQEEKNELAQIPLFAYQGTWKIAELSHDSLLVFLPDTGEPIAALARKNDLWVYQNTDLPFYFNIDAFHITDNETHLVKEYISKESAFQAELPEAVKLVNDNLNLVVNSVKEIRHPVEVDVIASPGKRPPLRRFSLHPPPPQGSSPGSTPLIAVVIGILICYRVAHLLKERLVRKGHLPHAPR